MDNERMEELEKIEAHGAENGWVSPMTEEDREFFAYFRICNIGNGQMVCLTAIRIALILL